MNRDHHDAWGTKLLASYNFLVLLVAACYYGRNKRRTLWAAVVAEAIGTALAMLVNSL